MAAFGTIVFWGFLGIWAVVGKLEKLVVATEMIAQCAACTYQWKSARRLHFLRSSPGIISDDDLIAVAAKGKRDIDQHKPV